MAVWGTWVLAGAVGSVLPYVATTFGWLPADGSWIAAIVGAAIVAFPQYIVLRLLIGHSSLAGAMWIPVSVVAWLAADLAMSVSAERITNALLSVAGEDLRGKIGSQTVVRRKPGRRGCYVDRNRDPTERRFHNQSNCR